METQMKHILVIAAKMSYNDIDKIFIDSLKYQREDIIHRTGGEIPMFSKRIIRLNQSSIGIEIVLFNDLR